MCLLVRNAMTTMTTTGALQERPSGFFLDALNNDILNRIVSISVV